MNTNKEDVISEDDFERVVNAAKEFCEDKQVSFYGIDDSLLISLSEYGFISKPSEPGNADFWTLILYVPFNVPGGPGFKVESVDLDDLKSYVVNNADVINYNFYGYEDIFEFWDNADTLFLIKEYISGMDLKRSSHAYDKPMSSDEMVELLIGKEA